MTGASNNTLLVSCLHLGFVLLTTTLSDWQFSQFSVHLTVRYSSLYFLTVHDEGVTERAIKTLSDVKINTFSYSFLFDQMSNFVTEKLQVGQALLPLCKLC